MATATIFMKFSWLFCFHYNSSLTNSTRFGNDSNYSKFNGENIATNCSRITVFASDGLTKKHFGHYTLLKVFPSDHQAVFGTIFYDNGIPNQAQRTVFAYLFRAMHRWWQVQQSTERSRAFL